MMRTLEIYGTGVHNLGAVMMAMAVARRLRMQPDPIRFAVGAGYGDASARGRMDFFLAGDVAGRLAGTYVRSAPKNVQRLLGIIPPREIEAVLDASGFSYSDAFGVGPAKRVLRKLERKDRRDQKLVLLPQAYGPFEDVETASACKRVFDRAELVFARDELSQSYANELIGEEKAILCPDFTMLLEPEADESISLPDNFVAFVPNFRMLSRADDPGGKTYISLVKRTLLKLQQEGIPIVIVLHSLKEDVALAQEFSDAVPGSIIVQHSNPLALKWVLGRARFAIGSRYHALVSALSQNVPCVGLGWAHKYEWLFRDFGCEGFLIDVTDADNFAEKIEALIDGQENMRMRQTIEERLVKHKQRLAEMWTQTEATILNRS